MLRIAPINAEFGRRLRQECAAYRLPYLDTSEDFGLALDPAFRQLVAD